MSSTTTTTAPVAAGPAAAEQRSAVWVAVFCYALWGLIPLFFVAVARQGVGPYEQVAQRSFWGLGFALLLVLLTRTRSEVVAAFRSRKTLGWLAVSTVMISANWLLFLIAITTGRQLDTSLAYFINPLLNMAVGALLFRERIPALGWVAVALAALGVAAQTVSLGRLPLLSLGIALTFLSYGVIRKRAAVSALTGVFIECLYLTPFGLAYVLWLASRGEQHFGHGWTTNILILLLGPATVTPLYMFSWAARRMPLSTLGFLQFIAPSLLFVVALSSGERLRPLTLVSFVLIWSGVALFSYQVWRKGRSSEPAKV